MQEFLVVDLVAYSLIYKHFSQNEGVVFEWFYQVNFIWISGQKLIKDERLSNFINYLTSRFFSNFLSCTTVNFQ